IISCSEVGSWRDIQGRLWASSLDYIEAHNLPGIRAETGRGNRGIVRSAWKVIVALFSIGKGRRRVVVEYQFLARKSAEVHDDVCPFCWTTEERAFKRV